MAEMRELSSTECHSLLRSGDVGRAALSTPNGPHIMPVNYSVVDDAIILRTSPYSVLGTYGRDTTLAFEIDEFDAFLRRGWSVVARGRAVTVTDRDQLDRIQEVAEPRPWVGGGRSLYLRLPLTELTGRKLGHWDAAYDLPLRSGA